MSFKVGQFLSSNITENNPFYKTVSYDIPSSKFRNSITKYAEIPFAYDSETKFQQAYISPLVEVSSNNGTTLSQSSFEAGKYYYIKIKVERNYSDQEITLKLENSSQVEDEYSQYIDTFKISKKSSNDGKDFIYYETIFAPNINFSQIRFFLTRNVTDFYTRTNPYTGQPFTENEIKNWKGRRVVITECQIGQMINLLRGNKIANHSLTKIGIQGPSGLLICINGQPIRIGPSGIFQIKNGYRVNFLSFVRGYSQQPDGSYGMDTFIIDYQYDTEYDDNNEQEEEGDDINGDTI